MTDNNTTWPLPVFHFKVEIEDMDPMTFKEVSGLDVEMEPIEYRAGDNSSFSKIRMPGLKKHSNITLKKGVSKSDNKFWGWINEIKSNTIKRRTVRISLLDESGSPAIIWKVTNAWPCKISTNAPTSDETSVGIETLELVHEGLSIENN